MASCERCGGSGEIILDWELYMKGRGGRHAEDSVDDCPDCYGYGSDEELEAANTETSAPSHAS